jgi:hypothetical protein
MRLAQTTRWLALAMMAALSVVACTPAQDPEVALVRSTIERYNTLLAQGYRTMNMTAMNEVATQVQAETEYIHMSSSSSSGSVWTARARSLRPARRGTTCTYRSGTAPYS